MFKSVIIRYPFSFKVKNSYGDWVTATEIVVPLGDVGNGPRLAVTNEELSETQRHFIEEAAYETALIAYVQIAAQATIMNDADVKGLK